jgi:chromosome segregation ATPase
LFLQLQTLLDSEQREAASIAAESAAIKGRIEGLSRRADLLSADLEHSVAAVSTARGAATAAEQLAAALEGRLAMADSAAAEHKRMHAHLRQVNEGLAREAQELHDGLEKMRGECDRHAAAVRALEVGRARIAHGLLDALAAVDADAAVEVRLPPV